MTTIKQEIAFKEVVGNGGNVTKAMINAGYSENTANTPGKLTTSKGWQQLMEKYIPDTLLGKKHKELFEQKNVDYFVFPKTMDDEEIIEHVKASGIDVITVRYSDKGKMAFYSIPDAQAIKSGLDMAYKLKGLYAAEKQEIATVIVDVTKILEKAYNQD